MSTIARAVAVVGSLYALMRNRLGINVATSLESQELSCTVAPDRRLVVLGHEPIAGFARDHGTVANEAAMLALHTLDSTTLLAEPTFVAPGDSCLRTDDPGWRWHCIAGHGQSLSDWERRPLGGALEGLAVDGHTHVIADVDGLAEALAGKQDALTISDVGEAMLALATPAAQKIPRINANGSVTLIDVPSGDGGVYVPDPVRNYPLTTDFTDSSGGDDLTATNAVITDGWAVLTDGYMQIPDGTDLDCAEWSIALDVAPAEVSNWMRLWDIGADSTSFVILAMNSSTGETYLGSKMAGVDIYASTASLRPSSASPNYWPVNSPSTYVVTYSADIGAKLYVNGWWVLSVPTCLGLATVGHAESFLGRSKISGEPAFTGRMRNARIWDVCLSPAQVVSVSI